MVLCPIALAVGCKRCPAFAVCPVKSVIGDYKPAAHDDAPAPPRPGAGGTAGGKRKPASNRKGARSRRPRK